jgi:2-dehydropantoate 2-reductase
MMNLGNAVQALCAADDDRNELVATLRAEGEAVLTAAGIDPISEADDRERRGDILQIGDVPGRPRSGGSSWQSLERGTGAIETDYLNGEIVWLARQHAVDTPANELIRREAVRAARERRPPNTVLARELLDRL